MKELIIEAMLWWALLGGFLIRPLLSLISQAEVNPSKTKYYILNFFGGPFVWIALGFKKIDPSWPHR